MVKEVFLLRYSWSVVIFCDGLTEFSSCWAFWDLQPTTCGQPLKANSSSSASILSFSSLWAWTICFSRNCTWAKWEVRASREEFSDSCSSSSFFNLSTISSSVEEDEPPCLGWPAPRISSSGLATAPTGAHRSPAPANTASLSEADSSSVDILRDRVHSSCLTTPPVYWQSLPGDLFPYLAQSTAAIIAGETGVSPSWEGWFIRHNQIGDTSS